MDNATRVADAVSAFGRGDIAALADEYFQPDLVWHIAGKSPLAGTYKGQEEVFGFFRTAIETTGGTFRVVPHAVLGDAEHGVLLAETTATRPDGRKLEVAECLVIHMEGGKFAEVWHSQYDTDAWDAFWA